MKYLIKSAVPRSGWLGGDTRCARRGGSERRRGHDHAWRHGAGEAALREPDSTRTPGSGRHALPNKGYGSYATGHAVTGRSVQIAK
eukprot:1876138-Heterocapsa_arctica.AAC.1